MLQRLLPHLASQFQLELVPRPDGKDYFRITGTRGHIRVEAATQPTVLYGVNWYLKYVAHLQVSPNGLQLGPANLVLPAPQSLIEKPALYPWRYALNENVDGYTAPYWDEKRWQHEIDILAMSGTNAILIERGMDLVLYQTFRDFGYSDEAIRNWIVQPAHQNWQLMGNMCCFEAQSPSNFSRSALSQQRNSSPCCAASASLRSSPDTTASSPLTSPLLTPAPTSSPRATGTALPAPAGLILATRTSTKSLSPSTAISTLSMATPQSTIWRSFRRVAPREMFQFPTAAKKVQEALMRAHPGALWMLLGWQQNPTQELLSSIDTSHVLIAEIEQGRIPREDRDHEFRGASWLYGGLWEFGGRTTMGAPLYDYAVRLPQMAKLPGSRIVGTALFTEGLDTNPFAFDLYTEMAWHADPVDLDPMDRCLRDPPLWSGRSSRPSRMAAPSQDRLRLPRRRQHGARRARRRTRFPLQFATVLDSTHAATWSPDVLRYDPADFAACAHRTPPVAPALRSTETYRYDLVDVARQVMANEGRRMLPLIKQAYDSKDKGEFARLTKEWLRDMQLQNDLLQTSPFFLLGRWLSFVPPWASSPAELDRLNYDARSILTTWGDRKASEFGLHEYGNRDWAGLTSDYYMPRWQMYFESLSISLATGEPPRSIDWYAFGDHWNHSRKVYSVNPQGDSYTAALAIAAHSPYLCLSQFH